MRGIQLSTGRGTMPASTGIPPLCSDPLFPGFVLAQSASSKLSQHREPIWLDRGRRKRPCSKINCLSLPGSSLAPLRQLRASGAVREVEKRLTWACRGGKGTSFWTNKSEHCCDSWKCLGGSNWVNVMKRCPGHISPRNRKKTSWHYSHFK